MYILSLLPQCNYFKMYVNSSSWLCEWHCILNYKLDSYRFYLTHVCMYIHLSCNCFILPLFVQNYFYWHHFAAPTTWLHYHFISSPFLAASLHLVLTFNCAFRVVMWVNQTLSIFVCFNLFYLLLYVQNCLADLTKYTNKYKREKK